MLSGLCHPVTPKRLYFNFSDSSPVRSKRKAWCYLDVSVSLLRRLLGTYDFNMFPIILTVYLEMETKICGKMSNERWRDQISLFLLCMCMGAQGGRYEVPGLPFIRAGSWETSVWPGKDTVSAGPEMFTFFIICNFFLTLIIKILLS